MSYSFCSILFADGIGNNAAYDCIHVNDIGEWQADLGCSRSRKSVCELGKSQTKDSITRN